MRYIQTNQFREAFANLPQHIQQRAKKQLALFFRDYRYPSLQTKKMEGHNDLFEGRVTRGYRFIYRITGDICYIIDIGTHDILNRY